MSEQLEKLQATMRKLVPSIRHCAVLGIDVIEAEKGKLKLILPYSKSIIANPVTGEIEFASVLWRRLLDELDKPVRTQ